MVYLDVSFIDNTGLFEIYIIFPTNWNLICVKPKGIGISNELQVLCRLLFVKFHYLVAFSHKWPHLRTDTDISSTRSIH